jgi:hypothetical protein
MRPRQVERHFIASLAGLSASSEADFTLDTAGKREVITRWNHPVSQWNQAVKPPPLLPRHTWQAGCSRHGSARLLDFQFQRQNNTQYSGTKK